MSSFEVVRTTTVAAPPARVHALVDDLREWPAWSPWEGLDPDLERTYSGPGSGPGARYEWTGNRRAGAGSMEIVRSEPQRVELVLAFTRPFRAMNDVAFELEPVPDGTRVTWRMSGTQNLVMRVVSLVMPMDKLVGRDFEKGLARLKQVVEQTPAPG